jgi:hypothetical protein
MKIKIFQVKKMAQYKFSLKVLLPVLFSILSLGSSYASPIDVQAKLDSSKILIGDQVHFTLSVEQPVGQKVEFPLLKDTLTGKIEILSTALNDTVKEANGLIKVSSNYLITCFDSGNYLIPSYPFVVNGHDTVYSTPVNLLVDNVKTQQGKFYDIKGPLNYPITLKELLVYSTIILAGCLIIALIVYIILRLRNKKPLFKAERPKEPAHVVAMRQLEALKAEKLWQHGKVKLYHTTLTDIVRAYLERRFNISAMESTTDEIIESLKDHKVIEVESMDFLSKLLRLADFVKFAKAEPFPDENENSWTYAYTFILNTKSEPKIEEPAAEQIEKESFVSDVKTEKQ